MPEVSAERFHEISDSLKRTFVAKDSDKTSIGAGFSFLAAFGKQESKNKSSGIEGTWNFHFILIGLPLCIGLFTI